MRTPTLRERLRGDEGAGSVEYIGAILVVVAIIGSVTVSVTPVGNTIMAEICAAFGAECGAGVVVAEPRRNPTSRAPRVQPRAASRAGCRSHSSTSTGAVR